VIAFIEHLTIASGKGAGEKFHLRPWQREIIEGIYATDQDGIRLVSEALMTVARKNGKTELAAALCLCHLAGPEAEPAGECYSAAADRHMAGRIFHELERFILKDNELSERCHIRRFTKEIEVAHGEGEGSVYQALSSDATKAHSLNPSFVVCDEVAQWRGRELFDNLRTGFGARAEPLLVAISTKSQDPHSVMSELVDYGRKVLAGVIQDPAFYAVIYETPIPEDPEAYAAQMTDEECWKLSNPALGDFRSLTEIRKVAAQALRIPAREAAFRSLYLNQEIDAEERAIPMAEWQACRGEIDVEALRGQRCYGGLDLSSTTDLTSLALYFPDSGALLSWSWAPKENIATREELDRVPYRQWVDQGLLRTTEGKAVNRREIARQLASIVAPFDLQLVGYDTWRIEDLLSILADEGIELPLVPFVQAASMMAPAYDAFETAVLDRALAHDGGQLLTWAVSNLALSTDSNGNRKPDKGKARERIDPAVAAIMAVGLAAREKPEDDTDRPFKGLTGGLISGRVQPLQRKGERRADAA
jgi:phage terminase large subunit-like protein